MVDRGQQLRIQRSVERLFTPSCGKAVGKYTTELGKLGFSQTGADPIALQFENPSFDLFVEVLLDRNQCVHSYQVLTFAERDARQQKFRW